MTDPQSNGPWQGNRAIGSGEGEVPLAPPPTQNVTMRTLASDVSSIQSMGGAAPRPYTPPPPPTIPRPVTPSSPSEPMRGAPLSPSMTPPPRPSFGTERGFTPPSPQGGGQLPAQPAPSMQRFAPSPTPFQKPTPPTSGTMPMQSMGGRMPARAGGSAGPTVLPTGIAAAPKKKSKGLVIFLVVLIVLALAAAGYFIVYPMVSVQPEPAAVPPVVPSPSPEPAPIVEPAPPTAPAVPPASPAPHASLFTIPADMSENVTLPEVNPAALVTALGFDTAEVPIFREVVLRNPAGAPLTASDIFSALDPGTFTPEVLAMLNPDATFFTYTDTAGTWFGAVISATANAGLPDLQAVVQRIEVSTALKNFFLSDPGTPGAWKGGTTEGITTRYTAFSKSGFALNYGWKGNRLVISSSYAGFKEALRRLE